MISQDAQEFDKDSGMKLINHKDNCILDIYNNIDKILGSEHVEPLYVISLTNRLVQSTDNHRDIKELIKEIKKKVGQFIDSQISELSSTISRYKPLQNQDNPSECSNTQSKRIKIQEEDNLEKYIHNKIPGPAILENTELSNNAESNITESKFPTCSNHSIAEDIKKIILIFENCQDKIDLLDKCLRPFSKAYHFNDVKVAMCEYWLRKSYRAFFKKYLSSISVLCTNAYILIAREMAKLESFENYQENCKDLISLQKHTRKLVGKAKSICLGRNIILKKEIVENAFGAIHPKINDFEFVYSFFKHQKSGYNKEQYQYIRNRVTKMLYLSYPLEKLVEFSISQITKLQHLATADQKQMTACDSAITDLSITYRRVFDLLHGLDSNKNLYIPFVLTSAHLSGLPCQSKFSLESDFSYLDQIQKSIINLDLYRSKILNSSASLVSFSCVYKLLKTCKIEGKLWEALKNILDLKFTKESLVNFIFLFTTIEDVVKLISDPAFSKNFQSLLKGLLEKPQNAIEFSNFVDDIYMKKAQEIILVNTHLTIPDLNLQQLSADLASLDRLKRSKALNQPDLVESLQTPEVIENRVEKEIEETQADFISSLGDDQEEYSMLLRQNSMANYVPLFNMISLLIEGSAEPTIFLSELEFKISKRLLIYRNVGWTSKLLIYNELLFLSYLKPMYRENMIKMVFNTIDSLVAHESNKNDLKAVLRPNECSLLLMTMCKWPIFKDMPICIDDLDKIKKELSDHMKKHSKKLSFYDSLSSVSILLFKKNVKVTLFQYKVIKKILDEGICIGSGEFLARAKGKMNEACYLKTLDLIKDSSDLTVFMKKFEIPQFYLGQFEMLLDNLVYEIDGSYFLNPFFSSPININTKPLLLSASVVGDALNGINYKFVNYARVSKLMKKNKVMTVDNLQSETKDISKEKLLECIRYLEDKGVVEAKDDVISYIP